MSSPGTLGVAVGIASAVVLAVGVGLLVYRSTAASSPAAGGSAAAGGSSLALGAKRREAVVSMDGTKPRVRILYGTQTGTAERFSKQLAGELRKRYGDACSIEVTDCENYSNPSERLTKEQLVVLCVATYGDGEPTDNAADFFSWLAKEVEAVEGGDREPALKVRLSIPRRGHAAASNAASHGGAAGAIGGAAVSAAIGAAAQGSHLGEWEGRWRHDGGRTLWPRPGAEADVRGVRPGQQAVRALQRHRQEGLQGPGRAGRAAGTSFVVVLDLGGGTVRRRRRRRRP